MSANFYATPENIRKTVEVNSPQRFIEAMNSVFLDGPWKLDSDCLARLRAMDAVGGEETGYWRLIELVEKYGVITVEAEY